jgi:hypothetical protein
LHLFYLSIPVKELQITYWKLGTSAGFMSLTSLYQAVTAAFQSEVPRESSEYEIA